MKKIEPLRQLAAIAMTLFVCLLALPPKSASASISKTSGGYHIELATAPSLISIGKSQLLIRVSDHAGKPLSGLTLQALVKMPSMNMGERPAAATEKPSQSGTYVAPAAFSMEGDYEATIKISGALGETTAVFPIKTGQDTGTLATAQKTPDPTAAESRVALWSLAPWGLAIALLAFVFYRMAKTGQRPAWNLMFSRQSLSGILLLALFFCGAIYAINHYRRPGAMTPIEAQAMQMEMPAPAGVAPAEFAIAERGALENMVRYSGQAVGFAEQEAAARVSGVVLEVLVYAGDPVQRGQLLARLDTTQSAPQTANQRAALEMAKQGTQIAKKERQQASAFATEARAEAAMRQSALAVAQADLKIAQEERANAQAEQEAAQTQISDAEAQSRAAQADQEYWRQEIARMQRLLREKAVTQEEYQREQAQARNADERARQAQAKILQTQAQHRAAQALLRKTEAAILSAQAKIDQAQAERRATEARIRSAQAAESAAQSKIAQSLAGERMAQATLQGALANQNYSEIRAQSDGVVTQRLLSPGSLVSAGQAILRIAQISPIRLQANVAEVDLAQIHAGSAVVIRGRDTSAPPLKTRLSSVSPALDPTTHTSVAEAISPNTEARFLPGQYLTMDISIGKRANALRIPTRALRYRTPPSGGVLSSQSQAYVWVAEPISGETSQYAAHEVAVKTGLNDDKNTEILSGLVEGQRVLVAGQDYLKEGDRVSDALALAKPQGGAK